MRYMIFVDVVNVVIPRE